jgi:DNA-directed RNA polymerase subunit beta'
VSEIDGTVKAIVLNDNGYTVEIKNSHINETRSYEVPFNAIFRVKVGDKVEIGDKITDGSIDINRLLRIAGIDAVRNYMIKEVQKVYRLQGIEISDKYIEVILRQMTNKVKVLNPGDSSFFIGEVIDIGILRKINNELLIDNKTPVTAINLIFGLDTAPSKSDSFLAAASFQDTKKILTDGSVKNQIDNLRALKENVMLGNLIPAGTGLAKRLDILENGQKMYKKQY